MDNYQLFVKGKNPDYFLRKIIDKNINIYNIVKKTNELYIVVDKEGYSKIKKIKTSYEIVVVGVSGILKLKELVNKYFFFILFFCIGIFLNVFLSNIIFDVEVVHSNKYIRDIIYSDLEDFGIKKFRFKVDFDEKEKIVSEILKKEKDDLEWIEIEEIGTRYIVKVEQRKKNADTLECVNRNIVAKKDAIILEITADSGEIVKKKNDYVSKGDVLISGVIHNKEDVVANKCAVGKVFGEVWYKVDVEFPTKYHEATVTGEKNYKIAFRFLDKKYVLFNKYDTYLVNNIFTLGSSLLPIGVSFSQYLETIERNFNYTLDNSDSEALKIAENRLSKKLGDEDVVITKKVLKKEIKNSKIIVEVFFKVKEDITAYREIVNNEISEEGDL